MNDAWRLTIVLLGMGIMLALFCATAILVVRYLMGVFRLMGSLRTNEPDLWVSLSRPVFFPPLQDPWNPFRALLAQWKFLGWFLKDGPGAQHPHTRELVRSTKRLFNLALAGFVICQFGFLLVFAIIWLVLGGSPK